MDLIYKDPLGFMQALGRPIERKPPPSFKDLYDEFANLGFSFDVSFEPGLLASAGEHEAIFSICDSGSFLSMRSKNLEFLRHVARAFDAGYKKCLRATAGSEYKK